MQGAEFGVRNVHAVRRVGCGGQKAACDADGRQCGITAHVISVGDACPLLPAFSSTSNCAALGETYPVQVTWMRSSGALDSLANIAFKRSVRAACKDFRAYRHAGPFGTLRQAINFHLFPRRVQMIVQFTSPRGDLVG